MAVSGLLVALVPAPVVEAAAPAAAPGGSFPIGFYDTSWAGTDARKYQALERIGGAGFNLMAPALELDDTAFLDRARALGVRLIVEANDSSGLRGMVQRWGSRPEIMGWIVADDFNAAHGIPLSRIQSNISLVNQYAPSHLTYMSGLARNFSPFLGLADLIAVQTYSIPWDPLYTTDNMLITTNQAVGNTSGVFANLQTYAAPGYRAPTPDEVRNMTYQSLLNQVDGILYYAYFDSVWDMAANPTLWNGIVPIATEVRTLSPVVLNGTFTRLPNFSTGVLRGQWVYNGLTYVVLVNGNNRTISNVTFPVAGATRLTPMFSNRPATFTLNNGTLVGSLGANQVQVYIVETGGAVVPPTATSTSTPRPTNTPTPRPTNTPTLRPTNTATPRPTNTPTPRPTNTPTFTPTFTATATNTATFTPTFTATATATNTATFTPTFTPTFTATATNTATFTPTFTPTFTATAT
ncbi:MAG: hypothetical protein MUE40_13540, partial [Anaerolineae bacterium]|nr:hypothetical protein [Anaerolineae bacterium]